MILVHMISSAHAQTRCPTISGAVCTRGALLVTMSNQLFVGRLPLGCRTRDIEDIFYRYGKMTRCDVKQGKRWFETEIAPSLPALLNVPCFLYLQE